MLDVRIECLTLNIENAAGQEHRLGPITERAVTLLAARLAERGASPTGGAGEASVNFDLNELSDEQAAAYLAGVMFEALALKLSV
jgi:hypothetical protein